MDNEPTNEPLDVNYIYTHEGIVQVPHTLIERDKGYPISVSAQMWRETQKTHVRVSGALFTANRVVDARSIVVLTQVNPYNGAYERCLWFVRFSVEGGSDKFERPFGENFLWQLGHPTCMKYLENMKSLYELRGTPPEEQSRLCYELVPKNHTFELKDWPKCWKVETLPCYYDRCFAMSLRPSRLPYIRLGENRETTLRNFSRPPEFLATLDTAMMQFPDMPDDIKDTAIVGYMAFHLASSPYGSETRAFLRMREVCKSWKKATEDAARSFLKGVLEKIRLGHQSERVEDIVRARNAVLYSGLILYPVLCDHVDVGIFNWMRLRFGKGPLELPPDVILARRRALKKRVREHEENGLEMLATCARSRSVN